MGHYASEMISDEEWERERKRKEERHNRIKEKIAKDIAERSLEDVLATIVSGDTGCYTY
jgi:hypothetical protein